MTLCQVRDAIASKQVSASEVTRASLDRIAAHDGELSAFRQVFADRALSRAGAVDAGKIEGPLAGVPVAIKDNLCSSFGQTACASKMLEHYRSPFTATAVVRLEQAGAIVLGKTNMDEFAMGSSTENSAFGPTRNPWHRDFVPGGSSGGSAAAVAARFVFGALGSDTGGSIRQPAALCGVVGMKPTYGRVSRYGLVAFASSLDQIGPLGRTVGDVAALLQVISGVDRRDSTSAPVPVEDYSQLLDEPVGALRIGLPRQYLSRDDEPSAAQVAEAAEVFRRHGAELVEVDLPHTEYAVAAYYIVCTAEASSNLARYDGVHYGHRSERAENLTDLYCRSRAEGFGAEVKRRIMLGTYVLSSGYYDAYYLRALKVRRLIKADFDAAFKQADVILCPTTTGTAFRLGEKIDNPLEMYLNDIYTVNANLAGLAAISLPAGLVHAEGIGLPASIQLLGPLFSERRLLQIAALYQSVTDHHLVRPPLGPTFL